MPEATNWEKGMVELKRIQGVNYIRLWVSDVAGYNGTMVMCFPNRMVPYKRLLIFPRNNY